MCADVCIDMGTGKRRGMHAGMRRARATDCWQALIEALAGKDDRLRGACMDVCTRMRTDLHHARATAGRWKARWKARV